MRKMYLITLLANILIGGHMDYTLNGKLKYETTRTYDYKCDDGSTARIYDGIPKKIYYYRYGIQTYDCSTYTLDNYKYCDSKTATQMYYWNDELGINLHSRYNIARPHKITTSGGRSYSESNFRGNNYNLIPFEYKTDVDRKHLHISYHIRKRVYGVDYNSDAEVSCKLDNVATSDEYDMYKYEVEELKQLDKLVHSDNVTLTDYKDIQSLQLAYDEEGKVKETRYQCVSDDNEVVNVYSSVGAYMYGSDKKAIVRYYELPSSGIKLIFDGLIKETTTIHGNYLEFYSDYIKSQLIEHKQKNLIFTHGDERYKQTKDKAITFNMPPDGKTLEIDIANGIMKKEFKCRPTHNGIVVRKNRGLE